jgi:hypothetical protein
VTDDRDGSGEVPQEEREDRPELDVDSAFAAIVAGWGDPEAEGKRSWPDAEDLSSGADRADAAAGDEARDGDDAGTTAVDPDGDPPVARPGGPLLPPLAGDPVPELEDDHDRFVPPDPPPLPRGDLATRLAWAGVAGGPVFLLLAALFWRELPQMLLMAAVVAFIAGFVTLVLRMPRDRSSSDDDDDGAVV